VAGETILKVNNLKTSFATKAGRVQAVRGISFEVRKGEVLGIVGESGSGKSVASLSILRVLPDNATLSADSIDFGGQDLARLPKKEFRKIRGARISMIFQDPMTSLNPLMTAGRQVEESLLEHCPQMGRQAARRKVLELFGRVRMPDAESRYRAYPHELSGGMRQRVMIAMALSCDPELLIADEPTTALDVTIQGQILLLLKELRGAADLSVIFITHDLGVVAGICDRVLVMYGGLVMEEGLTGELFSRPAHPYTLGLLASVPRLDQPKDKRLRPIAGSPPDMLAPPAGCPFFPRCEWARNVCIDGRPECARLSPTHKSMCWLLQPDAPGEGNPFRKAGGAYAG
jgi:oligopeptide transport system ATP-binding protein